MLVKALRNGVLYELVFNNAAYCPDLKYTLVSEGRMAKQGILWHIKKMHLYDNHTSEILYNIKQHYQLAIIKYNPVKYPHLTLIVLNSVQSRHQEEATPEKWHL